MYQSINRCLCGHRVFEDRVPLREDKVAGNDDAASFVSLGQQHEKNVSLVSSLRDVRYVVDDQCFVFVQVFDEWVQRQISLAD